LTARLTGLVYHIESRRVFRVVLLLPGESNNELDDPKWLTMGVAPGQRAAMLKVPVDSEIAKAAQAGIVSGVTATV